MIATHILRTQGDGSFVFTARTEIPLELSVGKKTTLRGIRGCELNDTRGRVLCVCERRFIICLI